MNTPGQSNQQMQQPPFAAPAPTDHGGRIELRLETTEQTVCYGARWYLAGDGKDSEPLTGRVRYSVEDGQISFDFDGPEPPTWLVDFTRALLRTTARTAKTSRWPRRITRWRAPPESPR